jgi:hypothetical protein
MKDIESVRKKLDELHAVKAQDVDYVAGCLDGACAALGWALGLTESIDWEVIK